MTIKFHALQIEIDVDAGLTLEVTEGGKRIRVSKPEPVPAPQQNWTYTIPAYVPPPISNGMTGSTPKPYPSNLPGASDSVKISQTAPTGFIFHDIHGNPALNAVQKLAHTLADNLSGAATGIHLVPPRDRDREFKAACDQAWDKSDGI